MIIADLHSSFAELTHYCTSFWSSLEVNKNVSIPTIIRSSKRYWIHIMLPYIMLYMCRITLCLRPSFLLVVSAVLITTASVRFWNKSGAVRWSYGCDFKGHDMLTLRVPNWDCGRQCVNNAACTHFTNTLYTCILKRNVRGSRAINSPSTDCGFIVGRSRQSEHVINDFLHNDVL